MRIGQRSRVRNREGAPALDVAVSTVVGTQLRHDQRLDVIDDKLEQVSGELAEARIEMNATLDQVLELLRGQ